MITNIFSRSNPMNFAVITILLLVAFGLTILIHYNPGFTLAESIAFFAIYPMLLFSVFFINFISQKNNLNKNDNYSPLFFCLFLCLIPGIFTDSSVVISNIFVLFALRRLLSIQSLITPKQKIFDASFWIAIAAIFQLEAILFLLLVFVAIILHVSNDFKNWIIPFVGVFTVSVLVVLYAFIFDHEVLTTIQNKIQQMSFDFENIFGTFSTFSSGVLMTLMVLLLIFQLSTIGTYLTIIQNSIKKIISLLLLALLVYIISNENNKNLLLYGIAPLSIISANFINSLQKKWMKEAFIVLLLVLSVTAFYLAIS